jgi:hypothetical protein
MITSNYLVSILPHLIRGSSAISLEITQEKSAAKEVGSINLVAIVVVVVVNDEPRCCTAGVKE